MRILADRIMQMINCQMVRVPTLNTFASAGIRTIASCAINGKVKAARKTGERSERRWV